MQSLLGRRSLSLNFGTPRRFFRSQTQQLCFQLPDFFGPGGRRLCFLHLNLCGRGRFYLLDNCCPRFIRLLIYSRSSGLFCLEDLQQFRFVRRERAAQFRRDGPPGRIDDQAIIA